MNRTWKRLAFLLCAAILFLSSAARAQLRLYETKYYNIYTDIDPQDAKEAAIRMTRMAEEYHARTHDFAGQIREKFPFYLYKSPSDFYQAGGLKGSAGVFMPTATGGKLMAIAGLKTSTQTWHTVQHEGFHQFAHTVIGGQMPLWLDEGLAEYFGESIFTGDGFVTGVIPPWRLTRLQGELADEKLKPFDQIMHITSQEWADQLNIKNYDQAWSMVYFFVHGDDQKYQPGFTNFIREISQGKPADDAWKNTLANNGDLQERWRTWWTQQPPSPTTTLYGRVAVATMTSFIARAYAQKQTFANFEAFHAAVNDKSLKINPDDWLPDSLITTAFRLYGTAPRWALSTAPNKQPTLALTLADGTQITGTFVLQGNRVEQVNVLVDDMANTLKNAETLLDQRQKDQARALVLAAIRGNPKSSMMNEARHLLQLCR